MARADDVLPTSLHSSEFLILAENLLVTKAIKSSLCIRGSKCNYQLTISLNQNTHQYELEGLLRHHWLGPLRAFDLIDVGWNCELAFLISLQVMPLLLIWKPDFQN